MRRLKSWPKPPRRNKRPFVRPPAVAGIFYPEEKRSLADAIDRVMKKSGKKEPVFAAVVPHGGILDAGPVAGAVYSRVAWTHRVVVMGPYHSGAENRFALMKEGTWETPLGRLPVDSELARAILKQVPELKGDPTDHLEEHGIEVQLPFLQRVGKVDSFVPILFGDLDAAAAQRMGEAIAQAIQQSGELIGLIATTDLTRYEPRQIAQENDRRAIERILALDEPGLLETVERRSISMCGAAPTAVAIAAAKRLGASKAALVNYVLGGDLSQEATSVVGFAGITIR